MHPGETHLARCIYKDAYMDASFDSVWVLSRRVFHKVFATQLCKCNIKNTNSGNKLKFETKKVDENMIGAKDTGLFVDTTIFFLCATYFLLCAQCATHVFLPLQRTE